MSNRKRRKKARPARTASEAARRESFEARSLGPRFRGLFFWGLAAGFISALGVVVAGDLGWIPISDWTHPPAGAEPAGNTVPDGNRIYLLEGRVPPGGILHVDGTPWPDAPDGDITRVTVPVDARAMEVKGSNGTWWSTPLGPETGDTLRPAWSGEIVVEAPSRMAGASLYVDGKPAGRVPGAIGGLAPGWHVISVREDEETLFEDARVVGAGEVVAVTVPALPPRGTARLIVRSRHLDSSGVVETQGRPVRVNGEPVGETPIERTVEAGFHSVAVQEPDRPLRVEVVRIEAGSTRYVDFDADDEMHPRLEIGATVATPDGGSVVIPVRYLDPGTPLRDAVLHITRSPQAETVDVPLVAAPSDPGTWLAAVPWKTLGRGRLRVFASGTDMLGRAGWSEVVPLDR